ncbi:MAG: hypothetical protein P1V18_02625 [Candidatus Gracilibacteria bacterium]|nr:hypothetical protein [Candidatus Gracilibacteria bacterium]
MSDDQFILEEAVGDVIEAIYASALIPADHKEKYVDYIREKGMSDKMIEELQKIFEKEEQEIDQEILDKQELLKGLNQIIQEEQSKNDEEQAEIVASVDDFTQKKEEEMGAAMTEIEQGFEKAVEVLEEKEEQSEQDAIRAKLGIDNPTENE